MDSKLINTIKTVVVWGLAAIGVILAIYLFVNIAPGADDNPTQDQIKAQAGAVSVILNFTIWALLGLVLVLIVAFTVMALITNFGKNKKSLLSTGIIAILVGIFYGINSGSTVSKALAEKGNTDTDAVIASSGIGLFILLFVIAVILAIFMGPIMKYVIKK
ncbi:MAG: hypothetical protein R2799_11125 [Crocinitomicaceae bacterium]